MDKLLKDYQQVSEARREAQAEAKQLSAELKEIASAITKEMATQDLTTQKLPNGSVLTLDFKLSEKVATRKKKAQ